MKISAVVVTYNRKQLLVECIEALLKQTCPLDEIVVLDNASTDGTNQTLQEIGILSDARVKYLLMKKNTGGSGGFYYGSKQAYQDGADWIWMMDDDCIPLNTALEELVRASKAVEASFFHSVILNEQGDALLSCGLQNFGESVAWLDQGLIRVCWAPFVSFFVNRNAIEKCGLPYKNYFIYGDDAEYSHRLIQYYGPGYLVGKSKAVHMAGEASSPWDSLDTERIKRGHYLVRNALININEYGSLKDKTKKYISNLIFAFRLLTGKRKKRFLKIKQIIHGTWEYWIGNYDRRAFKKRFENHKMSDEMDVQ